MKNTEELTDKAGLILDKILDAVNSGIDKAPEVVGVLAEEYVTYYALPLWFQVIVGSCLFIGGALSFGGSFWFGKKTKYTDGGPWLAFFFMGLVFFSVGIIVLSSRVPDLLQATYAPKAFLIENLRR